ncbi:MAG: D-arabinono-1,4-lactone oxidase [Bacteroidota bacterium]
MASAIPSFNPTLGKITAQLAPTVRKVFHSHKVYATQRLVRFHEMEYNVPLEAHETVLKEIIKTFQKKKFNIHFPVENRVVKGDDALLSPAYGRDSAYIACHVFHKKDYRPYFQTMEEIFLAHDGRPHWGKKHTLKAAQLREKYPAFERFNDIRKVEDPEGLFLNSYLESLFVRW